MKNTKGKFDAGRTSRPARAISPGSTPAESFEARIIQECRSETDETEARRRLLASENDAGVPCGTSRRVSEKSPAGERIGRRSRYSWMVRAHIAPRNQPAALTLFQIATAP